MIGETLGERINARVIVFVAQVGVFVLAFGLETYHHHKFHGHHEESHGEAHGGEKKAVSAASAKERAAPELDVVQREVEELGARVKAMRETMMGRAGALARGFARATPCNKHE